MSLLTAAKEGIMVSQKLNVFSGQTLLEAAIFCLTATGMVQIENSSFQQFALVQGLQNFRGPSNIMF